MKKLTISRRHKWTIGSLLLLLLTTFSFQNCSGQFTTDMQQAVANLGSQDAVTTTTSPVGGPSTTVVAGATTTIPTTTTVPSGTTSTTTPPLPPPTDPALPFTGKVTSFPLPNNYLAPYSSVGSSKHTNMSYSPLTNRLYVSGGDWVSSATDGTWSMDMTDGSWRQDVAKPVYPSLPAPHALQDGAGFVWVSAKQKFLMWPGSYYPYDCHSLNVPFTDPSCIANFPLINYSRGMWWLDPVSNQYTQETGLFGTVGVGSGSLAGGVFDEVTNQILVFMDSSNAFAVRRWDVNTLTRLADIPFAIAKDTARPVAYFTRGMQLKVGRQVYIVGYRSGGSTSTQVPLMLRWNLDSKTMEELPAPPVDGTKIAEIEVRLGFSNGKIVWPFMNGPDGELHGIYLYDPTTSKWYVDNQVPSYGNFIGNAVTSLPDGRVVWSGGVFGRQQTHIWFYEAK